MKIVYIVHTQGGENQKLPTVSQGRVQHVHLVLAGDLLQFEKAMITFWTLSLQSNMMTVENEPAALGEFTGKHCSGNGQLFVPLV